MNSVANESPRTDAFLNAIVYQRTHLDRVTSAQGTAGLYAGNDVNLLAGTSTLSLSTASFAEGSSGFSSGSTEIKSHLFVSNAQVTELQGDTASVFAGRDAVLEGTRIIARGNASVAAGNNLLAAAAQDSQSRGSSFETRSTGFTLDSEAFYDTRGKGNANLHETTTARGVEITSSQGNATLSAGSIAFVEGAQINAAQGTASIQGANVLIQAGVNTLFSSITESKRDASSDGFFQMPGEGLGHKATQTTTLEQTSLAPTTLSGQNVSVTATAGDLHIAGTTVTTPGTLTLGATGTLFLDGQQVQTSRGEQSQSKDLMYQKMRDQGSIEQSTEYNQFNAGTLLINAPRISAQIGSKNSAEQLAGQPGMEWVGQLLNEPTLKDKVDWKTLQDASENWDYKAQGLTPEGAAIVSIVVAFVTYGAASSAGGVAGSAVGGGTTGAVVGGAVTAGISTLASQAAVSLINNQGNIGKTLEDLGSSESLKALLTSMVTGGVLAGMKFDPTGAPTVNAGSQTFMDQLGQNLKVGVARSLISTAINGGSLEDSLKTNLASAFIDTAAAQGAFAISELTEAGTLNKFTQAMAHAMAGCVGGAAKTGNSGGCGAGAIGAVVGELSASAYGRDENGDVKPGAVQMAQMFAAIAGAVVGLDAEQINIAASAGANAAANNALSLRGSTKLMTSLRDCSGASQASCDVPALREELGRDAKLQSERIDAACGGGGTLAQCTALASSSSMSLNFLMGASSFANTPEKRVLVNDLLFQQIDDMTKLFDALIAKNADAGITDRLGAGLMTSLQMAGTMGVSLGSIKPINGTKTATDIVSAASGSVGSAAKNIYTATRPMESVFPELKGVNPHYVVDAAAGVNTNCASCVNAAQQRLTGQNPNAVASPSTGYSNQNALLPSAPFGFGKPTTPASVISEMQQAGSGATRPLIIQQNGVNHVINVVNRGGQVYFIDTQLGKIVTLKSNVVVELGRPL